MDQTLGNLLSPVWWVTVVLGTIVLHIVALRADGWLDRFSRKVSDARERNSKKKQEERKARRYAIRNTPGARQYYLSRAGDKRHYSTQMLLYATMFVILYVLARLAPTQSEPTDFIFFVVHAPETQQLIVTIYKFFCLFFAALATYMSTNSAMAAAEITSDVMQVIFEIDEKEN